MALRPYSAPVESSVANELPLIIILDWDGTVVGRVDYQSQRFALHQYYKRYGVKIKNETKIPQAFYPDRMLVRPGLVKFIEELTAYYRGNVYFFIYTASERTWAYKEIQWVEKTHQIKFQRPIFTRDDCKVDNGGSYRKSIHHIYPRLLKSIGKGHLTRTQKEEILKSRILIIDNNAVYNDMQEHLLICPHYHYMVFENLLEEIPESLLKHPQISQYVYTLINQGMVCPMFNGGDSHDAVEKLYKKYEWLALKCKHIAEENKYYAKDQFFKYLKKLILQNNLNVFTPNVVRQVQQLVWKKKKSQSS